MLSSKQFLALSVFTIPSCPCSTRGTHALMLSYRQLRTSTFDGRALGAATCLDR
jgi:hypothetical protein